MMDSLSGLEDWHWALAAIVFLILEILAPGVFFMWMGIAAGVVAAVVWMVPELSWQAQVLMFAGFSVVSAVAGRKWLNRHPLESEEPTLNRRGEQYIGRSFNLDEPIVNNVGKIRVDDTTWKISGPDCPAGNRVTVTGVDGVVLQVKCG